MLRLRYLKNTPKRYNFKKELNSLDIGLLVTKIKLRRGIMNLAKVSANGQLTLPVEIRRALGVHAGDKVLFIQKPDGEVVVSNVSAISFAETNKDTN